MCLLQVLHMPFSNKVRLGYGSKTVVDIETPKDLFKDLNDEFKFNFDPCPLGQGELMKQYPALDGLKIDWGTCNFVNPPYDDIESWILKGIQQCQKGNKSVFLIPVRTHALYWWNYIWPYATEVRFLNHFKFPGYKQKSPYGVAVLVYDPKDFKKRQISELKTSHVKYVSFRQK